MGDIILIEIPVVIPDDDEGPCVNCSHPGIAHDHTGKCCVHGCWCEDYD